MIRQEAHEFMNAIQMHNKETDSERQLSIVVEFVAEEVRKGVLDGTQSELFKWSWLVLREDADVNALHHEVAELQNTEARQLLQDPDNPRHVNLDMLSLVFKHTAGYSMQCEFPHNVLEPRCRIAAETKERVDIRVAVTLPNRHSTEE